MSGKFFEPTVVTTFSHNKKCFLGSTIPGKTIKKSLGLISMVTKGIDDNVDEEFSELLDAFAKEAQRKGGDAVINVRFETGTYEQRYPNWSMTYIIIYGEIVKTK